MPASVDPAKPNDRMLHPIVSTRKEIDMPSNEKQFKALHGDFAGQVGVMVGRYYDPSYNDIQLEFPCGSRRWFRFSDVCEC